jgi:hypothetical protein
MGDRHSYDKLASHNFNTISNIAYTVLRKKSLKKARLRRYQCLE